MAILSVRPSVAIVGYFIACSAGLAACVNRAFAETRQKQGYHDLQQQFDGPLSLDSQDLNQIVDALVQNELGLFMVLNFCLSLYAMTALVTTVVFLGRLSSRESAKLTERLIKYVVFKVLFVGAVVGPDVVEVTVWLLWFAMVGYMKMFVGAAKDRLETLMASPMAPATMHFRTLSLLMMILFNDLMGVQYLCTNFPHLSWTKLLLIFFDTAIIAVDGIKTLLRYGVHLVDHLVATWSPAEQLGRWESWEGKGAFLYHLDLAADVAIHLMTLAHYMHVWFLHGLSFHLVDALLFLDIRAVSVSLHRRVRAHFLYRAATYNLNHTFPDASHEDLQRHDCDCAICRDKLQAGKLLPCGHIFHLSCLRAWLQQSGSDNFTCPNCRLPLFLADGKRPTRAAASDGGSREQPHLLARLLHLTLTGQGESPMPSPQQHHQQHHQPYDANSAPGFSSDSDDNQPEASGPACEAAACLLLAEEQLWELRMQEQEQWAREAAAEAAAATAAQLAGPAAAAGRDGPAAADAGPSPLDGAMPGCDAAAAPAWRSTSRDVSASRLAAAATRSCSREPSTFTGDTLPRAVRSISKRVQRTISGPAPGAHGATVAATDDEGEEVDSKAGAVVQAAAGDGQGCSAPMTRRRRQQQQQHDARGGDGLDAEVLRLGLRRRSARRRPELEAVRE